MGEFTWEPDERGDYHCERCGDRVEGSELKDAWGKFRMHPVCDAAVEIERLEADLAFYKRGVEAYRANRKNGECECEERDEEDEWCDCDDRWADASDAVCAWEAEAKKREVE